jgi:FKBP-type peptidyl-prolyl cis-trans isomerase FkpA
MRTLLSCSLALLLITGTATFAAAPEITTDEQKTLYAIGALLGRSLGNFSLTEAELEIVKVGLVDSALQRPLKADPQAFMPKLQELQKSRMAAMAAVERKAGEEFLAKEAAAPGATKTESGLIMTTITPGTGASPVLNDMVLLHYQASLIDGKVFESSVERGQAESFSVEGVNLCWREALQRMQVGGKSRVVCPSELTYGDNGAPPHIKPGATLVFEMELVDVLKVPDKPTRPPK